MEFYEKHGELHGVNSDFEGCYHKMMLREGFEREFEVTREELASLLLSSFSLKYHKKSMLCNNFSTLKNIEITQIINFLLNDKKEYLSLVSEEFYKRISNTLGKGQCNTWIKDIY